MAKLTTKGNIQKIIFVKIIRFFKQFLFVFKDMLIESDQVIGMMIEKAVSVIQSPGVKWSMSGSEIRVTLTRRENPGINLTRQMFRKTVPHLQISL